MNSIEFEWRLLLSQIIEEGNFNKKDDSRVLEILGYHTFVPCVLSKNNFFDQKSSLFRSYVKSGKFDIKGYPMSGEAIERYISEFYDKKNIWCFNEEDGFVYTYPERLQAMRVWDKNIKGFAPENQINIMLSRLKESRGSNRAVATLYNCGLDGMEEDIPCLNWIQATIRNDELILHVMFRSNDIYGAWPSNMMFLMNVGLVILDNLREKYPGLSFKGIDYHVSSAHIYENDLDAVEKVLEVKK